MTRQIGYHRPPLRARPLSYGLTALSSNTGPGRASWLDYVEAILVAATVLLAPVNYLRLDAAYVTAADLTALGAVMIMAARRSLPITFFFGPATSVWLISFLAFAAGLSVSSVLRGAAAALPDVLVQYGFSLLILPLILAGRGFAQTVLLIKLFILSVVIIMLFGIYVVHMIDDPYYLFVSPSGRLRSLVERENACAVLGAMAMIALVGLAFLGQLRSARSLLALPVLFYGVLLTGSVSGLLTSAVGTFLLVLASGSRRGILLAFAAVCAVFALSFLSDTALLPEVFQRRVFTPLSQGNLSDAGTFADRYALAQEALALSRDSLLIGVGVDQHREISAFGAPVHNSFLLALVEGGLVALVGLLGLLMSGIYLAISAATLPSGRQVGAFTLVMLLVFFFVLNLFPSFYARFWNVPLILALSLSAACLPAPHSRLRR